MGRACSGLVGPQEPGAGLIVVASAPTAAGVIAGAVLLAIGMALLTPAIFGAIFSRVRLMVKGTRQAFNALRSSGNAEIPTNLRVLYSLPIGFV